MVGHLSIDIGQKQEILETQSLSDRANKILEHLDSQLDLSKVEKKIRGRVKNQMEKSQKEYYLNEQMKALKKELGEMDEAEEADALEAKILEAGMTKEAQEKALSELTELHSIFKQLETENKENISAIESYKKENKEHVG